MPAKIVLFLNIAKEPMWKRRTWGEKNKQKNDHNRKRKWKTEQPI